MRSLEPLLIDVAIKPDKNLSTPIVGELHEWRLTK